MARLVPVQIIDQRGRRRGLRRVPSTRGRRPDYGNAATQATAPAGQFLANIVKGAADVAAKATGSFIREIKTAVQEPSPAQRAKWDRKRYERQIAKQRKAMNLMAARLKKAEVERAEATAVITAVAAAEVEPEAEPEDVAEAALSGLGYGSVEVESGTFGGYGGDGRGVGLFGRWGRTRLHIPKLMQDALGDGGRPEAASLRGVRHTLRTPDGALLIGAREGRPVSIDLGNGLHIVATVDRRAQGFGGEALVDAIERATFEALRTGANPGAASNHWTAHLPWED